MTAVAPQRTALSPAPRAPRPGVRLVLDALSSMKVTVVLLLLLGLVTFAGTLSQQQLGLYEAQREFFESAIAVWDTQVPLFGRTLQIPMPGGYALLIALFVNLVLGGVLRHRWTPRNIGILVTHLGIGLLLIAGFVKLHWSYSGHVALFEGSSTRHMVSFHEFELALLERRPDGVVERTVPASALAGARDGVVVVDDPALPFAVEVSGWVENCRPGQKGPMFEAPGPMATHPDGVAVFLQELPLEAERERNLSGCLVKVVERKGRRESAAILWGLHTGAHERTREPFTFEVDGATWGLDLRRVTWDLPFEVRLDKFAKTDHPGTMQPRDFSSWVTVREDGSPERKVHIYMNHPLRSHDHVFFQTNWGPQPPMQGPPWYSVFEVAKNPSDAWPKYASYVVLAGLLVHFATKLWRHLKSNARKAAPAEGMS